ncbi:MAG: hypothetical protein JXB50_07655 [Spirochaetes bacterium]|nr:hypothetical protein [Spirochaetota bacterium]
MKRINYLIVFISSAMILSYELVFIRIFSITQWQSYTSLIISLALLGFGISGTIITFLKAILKKNITCYSMFFLICHLIFSAMSFLIYCMIPFNPFEIGWNNIQILYFILQFLIVLLPFITGSIIIGIQFVSPQNAKTIYFYNLIGSSFGVIITLILLNHIKPYNVLLVMLTFYAFIIAVLNFIVYKKIVVIILIFIPLILNCLISQFDLLKISEYKSIQYALKMPDSKILYEKNSPISTVEVVQAQGLREIKGLSFNYQGNLPLQKCIYFDADSPSAVTPFDNDINKIDFTASTTQALAYHIGQNKKNNVLIIGTQGGEGILRALYFNAEKITGLEINKDVIDLMKNELSVYSGNIYNLKNVEIHNLDTRDFIRKTDTFFDIIEISLIDSVISTSFSSINENYLFTTESFYELYKRLSDSGVLAVTRWIKEPAYDPVKLFNTMVETAIKYRIKDYGNKMVFIRSSNTATICISKNNIDIDALKRFSDKMSFDLIYFNGIKKSDSNKYFKIKDSDLFETCRNIINGSSSYIKNYIFNINAPSDNKPYFYNFIKIKTLCLIFKRGARYLSFNEWGFFLLLVILLPVVFISFILIIFPLFFLNKLKLKSSSLIFKFSSLSYFFIIGISYMFVEIVLIQKFVLFLLHPVYSVSIVIISMLFFSGLGSITSNKIKNEKMIFVFLMIAAILSVFLIFLNKMFYFFLSQNFIIRMLFSIILISLPAFFMGMPFPTLLNYIKSKDENMTGWVWAVNGFASVISSLLASLMNILTGFNLVLLIAVVLYLSAGILFKLISKISIGYATY